MAASASTQRLSTPPMLVRQSCAKLVYVCWQVPMALWMQHSGLCWQSMHGAAHLTAHTGPATIDRPACMCGSVARPVQVGRNCLRVDAL